jgi:NodT family efflux transporter outer membrane factor (OMF) lipoprotein
MKKLENYFYPLTLLAAVMSAALLMGGCAPIPTLPKPAEAITPEKLGLKGGIATELNASWWTAFKDPQLDALIERSLAESPSLAAARARVGRAAANAEFAGAADKPVVGAGFDATRQLFTEHGLYPPPIAGSIRTTANLQLGISYDWDFFGRHQAELAAALGGQQAAQADAAAARLMLASTVTRSYLTLGRVLAQRELVAQQIAEREQALALVRQRVAAGLDNRQELRGAETPLPELARQGLVLDEQATLLRHQLAALSAQPAAALDTLAPRLPAALPLAADTALGLDLLGRRPDVVAARRRVEAAGNQVTVARGQFYPNVNLTAFAGFNAIGLDQLFKGGSQQYGFGPSLRLPLFDTGRLRAQLKGSAAEADAAVAAYNTAVLDAVRDAGDQVTTLQSLQSQAVQQQALLANAESSLGLAQSRFDAGLSSRLALLNARSAVLAQQRQSLDLRGQTLEGQVNLMRALGGGFADAQ